MEVIKVQVANMIAESLGIYNQEIEADSMLGRDNAYDTTLRGEW